MHLCGGALGTASNINNTLKILQDGYDKYGIITGYTPPIIQGIKNVIGKDPEGKNPEEEDPERLSDYLFTEFTEGGSMNGFKHIYITGHSIGGSFALYAADMIAKLSDSNAIDGWLESVVTWNATPLRVLNGLSEKRLANITTNYKMDGAKIAKDESISFILSVDGALAIANLVGYTENTKYIGPIVLKQYQKEFFIKDPGKNSIERFYQTLSDQGSDTHTPYIPSDLQRPISATTEYAYAMMNSVSVQTLPAATAKVVTQVGIGDAVAVLEIVESEGEQWVHAKLDDGQIGYIQSDLLSEILTVHIWNDGSDNYRAGGFLENPDPSLKPIEDEFTIYIGSIQFSNGQAVGRSGNIPENVYSFFAREFSRTEISQDPTTAPIGFSDPATKQQDSNIPADAISFNGHSYLLFDKGMSWQEAKKHCESLGGHLAAITSKDEQLFIENLIKMGDKTIYWLGATDERVEGEWEWVTGEPFVFIKWADRQPDNAGNNEHYLQIYKGVNPYEAKSQVGKWNDFQSNPWDDAGRIDLFFGLNSAGFICEWDSTRSNIDDSEKPTPKPTIKLTPRPESTITIKGQQYSTSLTELELSGMGLTNADIEPLKYMTNLTWLNLGVNEISDISALRQLVNLKGLNLWSNQISDINALSQLTSLSELYLYGNQIRDISALSQLTNLKELWLSFNQISNIDTLGRLKKLTWLVLDNNQISDISTLSQLTDLETLFLGANPINDISALGQLKNLVMLALENTTTRDWSPVNHVKEVKGRPAGK